ncbi:MAG: hypothetical protein IPM08_05870 [Actinomycetales bacterium]|nr:hypothetical protein [Actinomycetales bacterium]
MHGELERVDGAKRTGPSRRALVSGAAWAAPAVLTAVAAPAWGAASVPLKCFTMDWGQLATGTSLTGKTLISSDPVLGAGPTTSPTLAISSGTSTAYNFEVDYRGVWYDNSTLTVAGMSATNTGMILNLRGANATETVTLSFSQPIRELTFVVYELNRWTTTTENDTLSFSQPVAITGTGLNATTGTGPFFRTATYSSLTAITVRTTATAAFSTFAITYLDAVTASTGGGYVGIGDLTICV